MDPTSWEFWQTLGMAILCGAILGVEREMHDKPAGLRTCIFVCLGSLLFVRLGTLVAGESADPTRVLGQVVTGVGFIGAGVILARGGAVRGVTTAAVIWVLAAIGAMIACGYAGAALAVTLVSVLLLVGLERISRPGAPEQPTADEPGDLM